jgi:ribosomal protein S18 acetylase RimI-like enzyme
MIDNNSSILIRQYESKDRGALRKISCDTAFLGNPVEILFDDREIVADTLTLYFTDYEPESCFVAQEKDKVIGYIIGTINVRKMNVIFTKEIFPGLFMKAMRGGVFFKKNSFWFFLRVVMSFLKGEFINPDFSRKYPAILHINIDEDYRGRKIGRQMVERYLGYLKEKGVQGVHVGTFLASNFFIKLGFKTLFKGKRSYLRYYLNKEVPYYILGKTLG